MRVTVKGDGDEVAHHSAVQLDGEHVLMLCGMQRRRDQLVQAPAGGRDCVGCAELAALPGPGRRPVRS